jgi:cytochrome c-type biogenesis protein CcmH/NrfG
MLGQVQMAKGDKAAAIASFEKALQLDPDNRRAKQMLDRAKGGQ